MTKCIRGLDKLHEVLARPVTDPLALPAWSKARSDVKAILFLCHYGTPPCEWKKKEVKNG